MKLYCANGCTPPYQTREFRRAPDETTCPNEGCGGRLETGMDRNARKRASRTGGRLREESPAEAEARAIFNEAVKSWPCFARVHRPGHRCTGRKDAHHLVPKDWIRQTYGDLPEGGLLRILFAPIIGAPACGGFHAAIEARSEFIHWHELEPEAIEFCERIDETYPGRPSMLARLEIESPKKGTVAV